MKLFCNRNVFKKCFGIVDGNEFNWVDSLIGKSNGGSEFMSFTEVVRCRLFENRLLIFKSNPWVLGFIWATWIAIHLSVVVQSENHRLEIVTVNIPLHYGISGGSQFPFNEVPVTLHISLKLVSIIFSVFHDWQGDVWVLLDFDFFKHFNFALNVKLLYQFLSPF